jgi:hypothetical protein
MELLLERYSREAFKLEAVAETLSMMAERIVRLTARPQ